MVTQITNTAVALSATSCFLSVIGGVLIIATFLAIPEIRNFTRKLMVCLTIADLLSAIGYSVSVVRDFSESLSSDLLCELQGTLTTFSSLASFFLTSITAIYIFDTVIHRKDRVGLNAWLIVFNMLSWGLPAWITSLAVTNGAIGMDKNITGPWCWIKTSNYTTDIYWMVFAGKGWEISCYMITTSLYVLLILHLYLHHRRKRFSELEVNFRDADHNFLYVWFVLYAIRVWGTIRCVVYIAMPSKTNSQFMEVLLCLQAVGDPLQAFCNSILFCFCDKTVRRKLWWYIRCKPVGERDNVLDTEVDHISQNDYDEPVSEKEPLLNSEGNRMSPRYGEH